MIGGPFPPGYTDEPNRGQWRRLCLRCGRRRGAGHTDWRRCQELCFICSTHNHHGLPCPDDRTLYNAFSKMSTGNQTQQELRKRAETNEKAAKQLSQRFHPPGRPGDYYRPAKPRVEDDPNSSDIKTEPYSPKIKEEMDTSGDFRLHLSSSSSMSMQGMRSSYSSSSRRHARAPILRSSRVMPVTQSSPESEDRGEVKKLIDSYRKSQNH